MFRDVPAEDQPLVALVGMKEVGIFCRAAPKNGLGGRHASIRLCRVDIAQVCSGGSRNGE